MFIESVHTHIHKQLSRCKYVFEINVDTFCLGRLHSRFVAHLHTCLSNSTVPEGKLKQQLSDLMPPQ